MNTTRIDLRPLESRVVEMITKAIEKFGRENPKTSVSCMGLYTHAFWRDLHLSFDTEAHSKKHVAKFKKHAGIGKDSFGEFCYCCSDFEFTDYAGVELHDLLPDFYSCGRKIRFINLENKNVEVDLDAEGNEGLNKVFMPFLKEILEKLPSLEPLKRSSRFRLGVEMLDSRYIEFWAYGVTDKQYERFRMWK